MKIFFTLLLLTNIAFAPNLFTPNHDGKNESFKILNLGNPESFAIQIFDRNGLLMFESSDPEVAEYAGWDGTVNGRAAPKGVYFWKVKGQYIDGKPVKVNGKQEGTVHLMR